MRRFNPEKELKKIQHGNKNKIIIGVVALLIILGISSSYALYQVRYSKRIIYTKVAPFSNNDIDLAVLVDGKSEDDFPEKDAGKIYEKIDCGKTNVKAYWDYDKWALVLETSKKAKCTVYFKTGTDSEGNRIDTSGANPPELYQGLIPIKYEDINDDGTPEMIVADPDDDDWYNYDNKQWANAVLIDNKDTTRVKDLSGNGNYATIVGGAQIGNDGLEVDGNDDGIFLDDVLKDLFKHSNTVQIKLKRENNNFTVIMGNYNTEGVFMVNYEQMADNILRLWYNRGNPDIRTPNAARTNELLTLTYVYDSTKGKLTVYQDGEKFYESNDGQFPVTNSNYLNVYIGRSFSQFGSVEGDLKGVIEKVMIYDKALTVTEIQQNLSAKSGKVGNSDGIVEDQLHLYYDFKVPQTENSTPGSVVYMKAVSQMYVWIPRYKYQLFNVNKWGIGEQEIKIRFEHGTETTGDASCTLAVNGKENCENAFNANWYTHPAFTFGDTDLKGIWVGKFESSGTTTDVKILPNKSSLVGQTLPTMFVASRNIEQLNSENYNLNSNQIDTHMMKNMEWGAMAYLSQSKYGRCDGNGICNDIAMNTHYCITGYDNKGNLWNTINGGNASTTGNIYGIYDASGSSWEQVMGILVNSDGSFVGGSAGFTEVPSEKYYNKYEIGNNSYTQHQGGHLGDATREIVKTWGTSNGWYDDSLGFPSTTGLPWFTRGGSGNQQLTDSAGSGIFSYDDEGLVGLSYGTFRVVITAQDGNE